MTLLILALFLTACFSTPPIEANNICSLLDEKVSWYKALERGERRWQVPKHLSLAFIHQESRFQSDARPKRDTFFGLFRSSSAYGFAQVKDETWQWYQEKTNQYDGERDNFADAVDFIGWYVNQSKRQLRIARDDVANQYLAYHEGHGGYKRRSFANKTWLVNVAEKVAKRANLYQRQLNTCEADLAKNEIWRLF